MQLEIITNNKPSYTHIRDGVAGNRETAFKMINLITNTVDYDKGFNDFVNQLLLSKGYNAYTDSKEILELVYSFIRNHVAYLPDKAGQIESIKSARDTLDVGYGDCDDLTILTASMLGVLGFENVNVIMTAYSEKVDSFEHIYTEVFDRNNKRFVLDLSLPQNLAALNYEVKPLKSESVKVFNRSAKDNLFGAIFNIKQQGKQLVKSSVNALPYASQFLPLGLIPANLLLQGVNLLSGADISSLSLSELGTKINSELTALAEMVSRNQIADDLVIPYAMQISSQLSAYKVDDDEQENFQIIKQSIKNKIRYIQQLTNEKDSKIALNAKGMVIAGTVIVGFIGYKLYTQGKF